MYATKKQIDQLLDELENWTNDRGRFDDITKVAAHTTVKMWLKRITRENDHGK